MGICPNCGEWVDEGDICMSCGGGGGRIYEEHDDYAPSYRSSYTPQIPKAIEPDWKA